MPPVKLSREEFEKRYRSRFIDPAFKPLDRELSAIVDAAWDAYRNSRKSPVTRKAGPGFADPDNDISVDWLAAREAIAAAQRRRDGASFARGLADRHVVDFGGRRGSDGRLYRLHEALRHGT
jgi:hypothetical protein